MSVKSDATFTLTTKRKVSFKAATNTNITPVTLTATKLISYRLPVVLFVVKSGRKLNMV